MLSKSIKAMVLPAVALATGCGLDKEKGILMAAGSYGDLAVVVNDEDMNPMARQFLARFNTETTFVIKPETNFQGRCLWALTGGTLAKGYKNALVPDPHRRRRWCRKAGPQAHVGRGLADASPPAAAAWSRSRIPGRPISIWWWWPPGTATAWAVC